MDRSRRATNRQLRPARSGRRTAPGRGTGPGAISAWPRSGASASVAWPLSASGRTANSPTASSVRATPSRRRSSPTSPSRSRLAGRSRSAPRAPWWPSSGRRRPPRAATWWSSPTRTTRLSQYDHTTGAYTKKPFSRRPPFLPELDIPAVHAANPAAEDPAELGLPPQRFRLPRLAVDRIEKIGNRRPNHSSAPALNRRHCSSSPRWSRTRWCAGSADAHARSGRTARRPGRLAARPSGSRPHPSGLRSSTRSCTGWRGGPSSTT